jgi:DNA invertase Pin-like site-specific DNA recombinase
LRVSDEDKQTPERSFAMQRQRIQEHLLAPSDLPFKGEYFDVLTGTSPNRADYQRMLADAQAGNFSHLALYRADRFGRNTVEGLQAATRLIGQGIKIRVAHMPSLRPEEPDGFFMFLIQMGLAQREVDVLKQRTADGMEAKLRAGGWTYKAPLGYTNRERQVSSNKYERWVEQDPEFFPMIRVIWDLLLTDLYSTAAICEELTMRGFTQVNGKPWAWSDSRTGERVTAKNRLYSILHNPFYAGLIESKRFGIAVGEIKGHWEPIITPEEYQRGIDILRKHDNEKSRKGKIFYHLRNLLWIEASGKLFKMFGSTPKPRDIQYPYYITHLKPEGKKIHIPCQVIDDQITGWLSCITIDIRLIPKIREIYTQQVTELAQVDKGVEISRLRAQLTQLKSEEAQLGRLLITGKLTDETYDLLRAEWSDKVKNFETILHDMERNTNTILNDLDIAVLLLAKAGDLYDRLDSQKKALLLQIIAKRIIVNPEGLIIRQDLHSPFTYLRQLVDLINNPTSNSPRSEQTNLGVLHSMITRLSPWCS